MPTVTSPREPSLAVEAMQRWPDHITPRADGRGLVIEGRNYPEAAAPAPAVLASTACARADGIDYRPLEGVLGDADRDHIDTMVLYPSLGLCAPSLEDPEFAAGSRGSTTSGSRTTAGSRAAGCAASR